MARFHLSGTATWSPAPSSIRLSKPQRPIRLRRKPSKRSQLSGLGRRQQLRRARNMALDSDFGTRVSIPFKST